jgi:hypothetical protein
MWVSMVDPCSMTLRLTESPYKPTHRSSSIQVLDLSSIKSHNWTIWPCSAVTGENLVTGLDWVVKDAANRLYYSSSSTLPAREA